MTVRLLLNCEAADESFGAGVADHGGRAGVVRLVTATGAVGVLGGCCVAPFGDSDDRGMLSVDGSC